MRLTGGSHLGKPGWAHLATPFWPLRQSETPGNGHACWVREFFRCRDVTLV